MDPEDILWLGGRYSWRERIRRGGIGSPKVIYAQGIPDFDQLSHQVPGQTTFVNFELLPQGLILRANCTQRIAAVGLLYTSLATAELVGHPIRIKAKRWLQTVHRIVYQGELRLTTKEGVQATFAVRVSEFASLKQFWEQEPLQSVFTYRISPEAPRDDSSIVDILDMLS